MSDSTSQGESSSLTSSFERWRKKIAYQTNLGITEDERKAYEKTLVEDKAKRDCVKCEEYKHWMLNYSKCLSWLILALELTCIRSFGDIHETTDC